jgi:hypothetical protein
MAGEQVVALAAQPARRHLTATGLEVEHEPPDTSWRATLALVAGSAGAVAATAAAAGPWGLAAAGVLGGTASLVHGAATSRRHEEVLSGWVHEQLAATRDVPPLEAVAAAVADALADAGLTTVGSDALAVEVHPGGEYRFRLLGTEAGAATFATALDEAIGPVGAPRYLVSRYTDAALPDTRPIRTRAAAREALRRAAATGEAWHPVPTVLGRNRRDAARYLAAWTTWVGDGRLLATARPEGAGILTAVSGEDPFAATTVVRRHWS